MAGEPREDDGRDGRDRVCPVCGMTLDQSGRCRYRDEHMFEEYGLEL